MDYYSAIKKNRIMPFAAIWMQLEIIRLGEVSQMERDWWTATVTKWSHVTLATSA